MKASEEKLSSYLAIKGPFVETTYRAFSDWDFRDYPKENFERIEATNNVGASSDGWLQAVHTSH